MKEGIGNYLVRKGISLELLFVQLSIDQHHGMVEPIYIFDANISLVCFWCPIHALLEFAIVAVFVTVAPHFGPLSDLPLQRILDVGVSVSNVLVFEPIHR